MVLARLLRPYVRPHLRPLLVALLAMMGEIAADLAAPVPFQRMVDLVVKVGKLSQGSGSPIELSAATITTLGFLATAFVAIALFDGIFTYLDLRGMGRVAQLTTTDLRRALFDHIQRLSLAFHQDRETRLGELQARLSGDVSNLQDLIAYHLAGTFTNGATAVLMLLLLLVLDLRLGLIAVVAAVPVYLVSSHYRTRLRKAVKESRREEGEVSAVLSESLSAARLVQVLAREDQELDRLISATARGLTFSLRASDLQARLDPMLTLSTSALTALILLIAAIMVLRHDLTVGQLTLVLAYTRGSFSAIRQLSKVQVQTQKAVVSAERLTDTFGREPSVREPEHPAPLPPGPLSVHFENVTFGYSAKRSQLKDVSWFVPPGKTVALVGPTGAGKTTLLSLLPRLYDPRSGTVRVGGVDVSHVGLRELRSRVTLVLQESLLFRDTIYNNIAYGRPEARQAEVLEAAHAAGVFTFAEQLEAGIDTVVSERGNTLSGGQKQCVAIARAFLRDTPVILMDEPTSSLDAATEKLVVDGIQRLVQGRTAIIIAHRFSTIRHADLVGVLKDGHLVQFGPPAELLRRDGTFAVYAEPQGVL